MTTAWEHSPEASARQLAVSEPRIGGPEGAKSLLPRRREPGNTVAEHREADSHDGGGLG